MLQQPVTSCLAQPLDSRMTNRAPTVPMALPPPRCPSPSPLPSSDIQLPRPFLAACRKELLAFLPLAHKEAEAKCPLPLSGPHCLEGTTLTRNDCPVLPCRRPTPTLFCSSSVDSVGRPRKAARDVHDKQKTRHDVIRVGDSLSDWARDDAHVDALHTVIYML